MQDNLEKLYREALVWDAHAGVFPDPGIDLNLLDEWPQLGATYLSINVGFDVMEWQETMATLAAYRRWVTALGDRFVLVNDTRDIDRARAENKFALSFDIEGMNALNGDINMVSAYHTLGVRQMLFAYNLNNVAAGGCHDQDTGLTDFGRAVVDEMNRVGMVIDCSHSAYKTTMEAMQRSTAPVIFSHSNALALADHGRNIRDEQIRACAAGGGVIGINGLSLFLGDKEKAKAETVARHVAYIADLVGHEHVGISLDFDPAENIDDGSGNVNSFSNVLEEDPEYWPPEAGYDRPIDFLPLSSLPGVCDELLQTGFTEAELAGILGGNFRRVAELVWK